MRIDMCINMRMYMCIDMCVDMIDMCIHMRMDMCREEGEAGHGQGPAKGSDGHA